MRPHEGAKTSTARMTSTGSASMGGMHGRLGGIVSGLRRNQKALQGVNHVWVVRQDAY